MQKFGERVTFSKHIGTKVYDAEGRLVALGMRTFCVFEKKGNAIV